MPTCPLPEQTQHHAELQLQGHGQGQPECRRALPGRQPRPKGTRFNAISAGPIHTLAASGIKSFRKMLDANEKQTLLRRNLFIDEVGKAAACLCSGNLHLT